jgi:hypothetical protein
MSRENESPIDPRFEPESAETPERLAEVERNLKKARPRPVELDAFALERMAHPAPLVNGAEQPARRRRYRPVVAVVGSWACGALVGAIVMFLVMSQNDSKARTAEVKQGITHPAPAFVSGEDTEDTTTPPERRDRIGLDAAVLALSSASPANRYSAYWHDRSAFRAGMHLSRFADGPRATTYIAPEYDQDASPKMLEYGQPAPAITREEVLRDLLDDPSGFVL